MQLLLALFIIYNGAMNIIKTLHSKKLSKYAQFVAEKYNKIMNPKAKGKEEQREKFKEIDNNINEEARTAKRQARCPTHKYREQNW